MPPSPGAVRTIPAADFGDIRSRRDCNPELRLAQRRRIIRAVSAHANNMTAGLEYANDLEFILR